MSLKVSSGLRNQLLDTGSFKTIMDDGLINIYSGTPPVSANDAIGSAGSNTLLSTISVDGAGGGLNMDSTADTGILAKDSVEIWKGTNAASGTASFYRHVASGDTGGSSSTEPRLQGLIAVANAEMNFTSTTLSSGAEQLIDYYSVAFPTL